VRSFPAPNANDGRISSSDFRTRDGAQNQRGRRNFSRAILPAGIPMRSRPMSGRGVITRRRRLSLNSTTCSIKIAFAPGSDDSTSSPPHFDSGFDGPLPCAVLRCAVYLVFGGNFLASDSAPSQENHGTRAHNATSPGAKSSGISGSKPGFPVSCGYSSMSGKKMHQGWDDFEA